jgi:predicted metal-dependent hydrolase
MPGNFDIDFRIRRSNRRSVVGQVMPDGNIEIRAPLSMTTNEINKFIDRYEPKFLPIVTEYRRLNAFIAKHPFGYEGEVLFLGKWVQLKTAEDDNGGYMVTYKNDEVVIKPGMSEERLRYFVGDLFSNLAIPIFEKKLIHYSRIMDVRYKNWTIGNARKRHGSCSSDGKITLSWRIIMMDESIIDYVIVHELAHLKHMNHAKDFKDEVAMVLPDWKERQKNRMEQCLMLRSGGWL